MTLDEIREIIAKTGVVPDMDAFDPEKSFEDNGVDSLDTYTILLALEEETGHSLEGVPLEKIASARALHDHVTANKA